MGIVQWQENHPSRWTCAQEELSVPEASKEGPAGGVWGFGQRVAACGLDHLTALGPHPSSLCPISGLLSASPQCQDLRQLQVETLAGEGRPPWDLNPSEMEQLQNCVPLFPLLQKFPSFPRTPQGEGLRCLQGPDPGVPIDQGPWDEELLPNSCEFTLGLPPPLW